MRINACAALIGAAGFSMFASSAIAQTDDVACVQFELERLGYPSGPVDGVFGDRTAAAGAAFSAYLSSVGRLWDRPILGWETAPEWCVALKEFSENPEPEPEPEPETVEDVNASEPAEIKPIVATITPDIAAVSAMKIDEAHLSKGIPYQVVLEYDVDDAADIILRKACFTWNGENRTCTRPSFDRERKEARVFLTTTAVGDYVISGSLEYLQGGQTLSSNTVEKAITIGR